MTSYVLEALGSLLLEGYWFYRETSLSECLQLSLVTPQSSVVWGDAEEGLPRK